MTADQNTLFVCSVDRCYALGTAVFAIPSVSCAVPAWIGATRRYVVVDADCYYLAPNGVKVG